MGFATINLGWQLWENDENLIRAELSPSEQAEHLAKRKNWWGQRGSGQSSATGGGSPGENKGFAAETPDTTGMPKVTVNQAISSAENIPNSIMAMIKGTAGAVGFNENNNAGRLPETWETIRRSSRFCPPTPNELSSVEGFIGSECRFGRTEVT